MLLPSLLATPPIPQLFHFRVPRLQPILLAIPTPPALLLLANRQTPIPLPSATPTLLILKPKPLTLVPAPELLLASQQSPLVASLTPQACYFKPALATSCSVPPIRLL